MYNLPVQKAEVPVAGFAAIYSYVVATEPGTAALQHCKVCVNDPELSAQRGHDNSHWGLYETICPLVGSETCYLASLHGLREGHLCKETVRPDINVLY